MKNTQELKKNAKNGLSGHRWDNRRNGGVTRCGMG